jgi:hypothetical protein
MDTNPYNPKKALAALHSDDAKKLFNKTPLCKVDVTGSAPARRHRC